MPTDPPATQRGIWSRLAWFGRKAEPPPFVPLFPERTPEPAPVPALASAAIAPLPKIIYALWLQGEQQAPDLVRFVLRRWADLNPDYRLRVLNREDAERVLTGFPIPLHRLSPQALSDILRAKLLLNGGVWTDASVLPAQPLDTWLPDQLATEGFFAFSNPGADRPLSSWFLAATPRHVLVQKWWREVERFWSKPRTLANVDPTQDPAATVAPELGGASNSYPYFWFHYLFRYLMNTDADFAARWDRSGKLPAQQPHELQFLYEKPGAGRAALYRAVHVAPVHKLNWRRNYPLDVLADALRTPLGQEPADEPPPTVTDGNLARNKPASQSSTSPWSTDPSPAIDASVANNGDTVSNREFHTLRETEPWWQVDLQDPVPIRRVVIFNRRSFQERLRRFTLLRSLDGEHWTPFFIKDDDSVFGKHDDKPFVAMIEGDCLARFVRVRLDGHECLHFRECQVFGDPGSSEQRAVSADQNERARAGSHAAADMRR